ncbi:thiosulfate oxidation carrier protein SoxY [Limnohabitans sp. Rim11]|jgi:sulfur-oxidizing protein SoxY|uniref:thiosulfate oxidation carrier protein SoxY n=1 Tax=Limnohabitans sp. Rim11 TaxID=1100719 RepID=UPI000A4DE94E|nr:thiosulfate oxidation carrier protein SoxY [Limnohabitans sp. Rim11]
MNAEGWLRRKGLQSLLLTWLVWPGMGARLAYAQRMNSGRLQSFEDMVQPIVKGAPLVNQDVSLEAPILADNGSLVPVQIQVASPMSAPDHVTHIYLLSQRNPVTQMAVFHLGPWNGRAEVSTRVRLAGTQQLVALARLSNGEFRYKQMEVVITESACVDAS